MYRYLIRRLLWAGVLFVAVTIVSYIIFFLVPAEPARLIAGPQATPDHVARVRKQMGLDDPVVVQYGRFFGGLMPVSFDGGFHFKDSAALTRRASRSRRLSKTPLRSRPRSSSAARSSGC